MRYSVLIQNKSSFSHYNNFILYTISLCKRFWCQLYSKGFVWNFEIFQEYDYSVQRGIDYQAMLCRKCMLSIIIGCVPPDKGHAMKFDMMNYNKMSKFHAGNPPYWRIFRLNDFPILSRSTKMNLEGSFLETCRNLFNVGIFWGTKPPSRRPFPLVPPLIDWPRSLSSVPSERVDYSRGK